MRNTNTPTSFKALQIITYALCIGVVMFLGVAFMLKHTELVLWPGEGQDRLLNIIALVMAVASVLLSNILFQSLLSKIDTGLPVSEKLPQYVTAYVVRFALMEGMGLFNVVVFLLTGCLINAAMAIAIILLMLAVKPTREKTIDDLKVYYPDTLD
ncbi:hypothetical protein [uncultured Mucilaginibacter sp.]|uniref:hypothetical protein n=1 Tax=uncultured Mucilaginibacter sp. TaxID=797541 RepID=UPI0025FD3744|nr:hypothetical protein [uncultured Mucilaginibacter sp.]